MPLTPNGASSADATVLAISDQELPLAIAAVLPLHPDYTFVRSIYFESLETGLTDQQLIGKVYKRGDRQIFISCILYENGWQASIGISNLLKQIGKNLSQLVFFKKEKDSQFPSSPKDQPITLSLVDITEKTIAHETTDTGISSAVSMRIRDHYKLKFKVTVTHPSAFSPQNNLENLLNRILRRSDKKLGPNDEVFFKTVSELTESSLSDLLKEAKKREIEENGLPLTAMTLELIACASLKLNGITVDIASHTGKVSFIKNQGELSEAVYYLQRYSSFDDFVTQYNIKDSHLQTDKHLCFIAAETTGLPFFIFCEGKKIVSYCFQDGPRLEGSSTIYMSSAKGLFNDFVTYVIEAVIRGSKPYDFSSFLHPYLTLFNLGVELMKPAGISQKTLGTVQICDKDSATGVLKDAYQYYQNIINACTGLFLVEIIKDRRENHIAYVFQYPGVDEVVMVLHPLNLQSQIGLDAGMIEAIINEKIPTVGRVTTANTKLLAFMVDRKGALQLATKQPGGSKWQLADFRGKSPDTVALEYIAPSGKPSIPRAAPGKFELSLRLNEPHAAAASTTATPTGKLKKESSTVRTLTEFFGGSSRRQAKAAAATATNSGQAAQPPDLHSSTPTSS